MKLIAIIALCVCLGSCINNRVNMPPKDDEVIMKVDPARLCQDLQEKVDYLTAVVSQLPQSATLPKPPPTVCKSSTTPITFESVPQAPKLTITENDSKEQLLSHIDALITHIENLQIYIKDEHEKLRK